jgi:hypothetical protein
MQYLLMIYGDEQIFTSMNMAEHEAEYKRYMAFGKEFASSIVG